MTNEDIIHMAGFRLFLDCEGGEYPCKDCDNEYIHLMGVGPGISEIAVFTETQKEDKPLEFIVWPSDWNEVATVDGAITSKERLQELLDIYATDIKKGVVRLENYTHLGYLVLP